MAKVYSVSGNAYHDSFWIGARPDVFSSSRSMRRFANRRDVVNLALPRGGVPIAYEVAVAIGASLNYSRYASSAFRDTRSSRWAPSAAAARAY